MTLPPLLLVGCAEVEGEDLRAPSEQEVAIFAAQNGWSIDRRVAEHKTALPHTGLRHSSPKTQDEVLVYAQRAWGLPKRMTGKAMRAAAKQAGTDITPEQSLLWVDGVGRAGEVVDIAPKKIIWTYLHERENFARLGFSFEEAIAIIAGLAVHEQNDFRLLDRTREVNEALLDEQVRGRMGASAIQVECKSGFDLLSQLDLAQRAYPAGEQRDAFMESITPSQWQLGVRLAMDARSRKVACDMVGHLRCARGYTKRQLESLPVDDGLGNPGTDYAQASAAMEVVGKAIFR